MRVGWGRFILGLIVLGLAGLMVGAIVSPLFGVCLFSFGLFVWLILNHVSFIALQRWSEDTEADLKLEGRGAWDGVFARLYRHDKNLRHKIEKREGHVARLVAAIEALTDGVVLLDTQYQMVFCNRMAAVQLGLRVETDLGQPINNMVRQPEFISFLESSPSGGALKVRLDRRPDHVLSVHLVPYTDERWLMQIRDVTQTERIDEMRRDFVANVSHELRTPLTVLSGFLETLQDIELTPEAQKRYLQLMMEQSMRMHSIVQDLLTLSAIEAAPPPQDSVVDMVRMLEKLGRDAERLSGGKHTIIVEGAQTLDLLGDEAELLSAFSNLVSNAVRYTPMGGRITLRWHKTREGARFSVEDTGVGIEAKHIPRLTERFYRVDRGRSRDIGGTGLGLAIVKHSLNRHGAVLTIESTLGVGSSFSADFPDRRILAVSEGTGRP